MKLETEKKKRTIGAIALVVVSALLLYRGLRMPTPPPELRKVAASAQPISASSKPRPGNEARSYVAMLLGPTINPRLRFDLLAFSEGIKYQGTGRDIFAEHEDIPPAVAPGLLANKEPYLPPPPPPPPPPIKLKFWGWASQPGDPIRAAFLAQGETGFVAREGDIVARRYKVVKIGSSSIEIEDVLSNNRQSIPVTF